LNKRALSEEARIVIFSRLAISDHFLELRRFLSEQVNHLRGKI